jgi:hypothetical protein
VSDNNEAREHTTKIERLLAENERQAKALEEIKVCCSPFDLDPLQRALNAVEYCQEIARAALHTDDSGDRAGTEGERG